MVLEAGWFEMEEPYLERILLCLSMSESRRERASVEREAKSFRYF